jgi:hypothetical protein
LTSAIRRRPRYGRCPNVAWRDEFGKGRGEGRRDYGIRPRAGDFGWISLVPARIMQLHSMPRTPVGCRTMASMGFFYGGRLFTLGAATV